MDPRIDPGDQVMLPVQALDLPEAQAREQAQGYNEKRGEPPGPPRFVDGFSLWSRRCQGTCPISWLIGIMFVLR